MSRNLIWLALSAVWLGANSARAEVFSKDILSLRDPFKHPTVTAPTGGRVPEIETFSTEQFKFLGVVIGGSNTRAMIIGPNGKTYFVHEHMRIGTRKGVITHITDTRIQVRERFLNVLGQEEVSDVAIEFPPDELSAGVDTDRPDSGQQDWNPNAIHQPRSNLAAAAGAGAAPAATVTNPIQAITPGNSTAGLAAQAPAAASTPLSAQAAANAAALVPAVPVTPAAAAPTTQPAVMPTVTMPTPFGMVQPGAK